MHINVNEFARPCECGMTHNIYVKDIIIEVDALNKLPDLLSRYFEGRFDHNYHNISVICDENTYEAAGKKIESLLVDCSIIKLNPTNLHADNQGVELASRQLLNSTELILAVGSGTIHDISRYLAHELGIPFISIPTAASVDGFVSTVAAMTWDGLKKTLPAVSPILVIADTNVFMNAPYRLTASGISDLLGKYTALTDWKIAHLVTGEYICNRVCELEYQALNEVCSCMNDLQNDQAVDKRIQAYEQLMYALLLSGIAMQMVGNSRPASGSEHHISHLWEMEVINPHIDALHGEKVSIGLILATHIYHIIKDAIRSGEYDIKPYHGLEYDLLKETFGLKGLCDGILEENKIDPLKDIDIKHFEGVLIEVAEIIDKLPTKEYINTLLSKAGCCTHIKEIGLDKTIIPMTLKLSPYVRNRLTMMRLLKLIKLQVEL
jgi:glycerol-1-phosphate dehydrogenase [NAD(P)+]